MCKGLKKFLKKKVPENEELAILDAKLGNVIKEKLGIPCIYRYFLINSMLVIFCLTSCRFGIPVSVVCRADLWFV